MHLVGLPHGGAAIDATTAAALAKIATGTQFSRLGPARAAAIDGAKPPSANPNSVLTATPDLRTRVSNCSLHSAYPTPP